MKTTNPKSQSKPKVAIGLMKAFNDNSKKTKKQQGHLLLFSLLLVILVASSCSHHYGPPMTGKQDLHLATPGYDSTSNTDTYIGGNFGMQGGFNEDEDLFYAMPAIHKAHSYQFFDLAYGMYGYAGGYEVKAISEQAGTKGFYGLGARGAANFNMRYDNLEIRALGIKAAFSREFGGYRQFRSTYKNRAVDTLWMHNTNGYSLNLAASSALIFKSTDGYLAIDNSAGWNKNWEKPKFNSFYYQVGFVNKTGNQTTFIYLNANNGYGTLSFGIHIGLQMPLTVLNNPS